MEHTYEGVVHVMGMHSYQVRKVQGDTGYAHMGVHWHSGAGLRVHRWGACDHIRFQARSRVRQGTHVRGGMGGAWGRFIKIHGTCMHFSQ